jgi:hypothetical protein
VIAQAERAQLDDTRTEPDAAAPSDPLLAERETTQHACGSQRFGQVLAARAGQDRAAGHPQHKHADQQLRAQRSVAKDDPLPDECGGRRHGAREQHDRQ